MGAEQDRIEQEQWEKHRAGDGSYDLDGSHDGVLKTYLDAHPAPETPSLFWKVIGVVVTCVYGFLPIYWFQTEVLHFVKFLLTLCGLLFMARGAMT